MSNKANWTGAIAGVVAAGAAVAALFLPIVEKKAESKAEITTTPVVIEAKAVDSSSKDIVSVPPQKTEKTCGDRFNLSFESAKALSLTIYQDKEYKLIIDKALALNCFNEANAAASSLSLSIYKDAAFKKIYRRAIEQKEFDVAKKAVNKLSLTIYQDEGNQAILEALRNET